MDEIQDFSIEINLKSVNYLISVSPLDSEKFLLEIQTTDTGETWKGSYSSSYIEELTRKTGNFKSFPIFLNMLQAALKQESSTVILDILTYSDLEMLRGKNSSSNSLRQPANTKSTNNKRYLILTYNVEFDRINYPLQLNYQGVPEPVELLRTIRKLKNELKFKENPEYRDKQFEALEKKNATLIKEKEFLGLEVLKLRNDAQRVLKQGQSQEKEPSNQQEIKVLKQMMKSLEESSIKEKNYFQRQIIKKDEEISVLRYQIETIRASEKNLMNQIKFSEEKFRTTRSRNNSRNTSINDSFKKNHNLNKRSTSQESLTRRRSESPFFNYDYINSKKALQQNTRNQYGRKPVESSKNNNTTGSTRSRYRSNSLDRNIKNFNGSRGVSPENSRGISPASSMNSLNSYASGSKKRFNPTDYVNAKKNKSREVEMKRKQEIRYKITGNQASRSNSRTKARSSSINSNYSYDGDQYNSSVLSKNREDSFVSNYSELDYKKAGERPSRNSHNDTSNIFNRDHEMKEIDDKLKSLQMLIKNTV